MLSTVAGRLFLVATPIGNLADLSARARETLATADYILAEDTRRARVLLSHIGISTRPVSLHAHNEAARVERAARRLARGDDVALISDAGTPLLSDPGERLVRRAIEEGCDVVPIPGSSAVLAALAASGLPCVPFTFVGFLPRKAGKRTRALERIIEARETTVLFESPARLVSLLEELAERAREAGSDRAAEAGAGPSGELGAARAAGGGRRVAVCREMTKVHEEVVRGTPGEVADHYRERPPRGEVTVVVAGRGDDDGAASPEAVEALAREAVAAGMAPTAAAREVARRAGVPRGEAYEAVMRVRK
ncbi:MAG: 16S rRNA (cytidine(1402)-2'-O)-methyltransferase, partial [Gemmatimonadetes bacterium]|nr:16S rRNA (cytidine(1402)-2'-O)-methyltransferase [Gemmatimonadota bacterium]